MFNPTMYALSRNSSFARRRQGSRQNFYLVMNVFHSSFLRPELTCKVSPSTSWLPHLQVIPMESEMRRHQRCGTSYVNSCLLAPIRDGFFLTEISYNSLSVLVDTYFMRLTLDLKPPPSIWVAPCNSPCSQPIHILRDLTTSDLSLSPTCEQELGSRRMWDSRGCCHSLRHSSRTPTFTGL